MNLSTTLTFSGPPPELYCKPVSYPLLSYSVIPFLLQGSLLHPQFRNRRIFRWIRLALTPLNVYLNVIPLLEFCFLPASKRGSWNFCWGIWCTTLVMKSLEWGVSGGFFEGKYWTRKEVAIKGSKTAYVDGTPLPEHSTPAEILNWTLQQAAFPCGVQFGWGSKATLNTRRLRDVMKRMCLMHFVSLISTAFAVSCRDLGSPTNVLLALGFPSFPGLTLLAEAIASISFTSFLISWFDVSYTYFVLVVYGVKWLDERWKLPVLIMEWFNPAFYPPAFSSPQTSASLRELWNKDWHQFLRRNLVLFGAQPAIWLAKRAGFQKTGQRVMSTFSVFLLSGILHEIYILTVYKGKGSFLGHASPKYFPGALFYFLSQPFGLLIEPHIIPRIPRYLGGGTLWVWLFSLATLIPYRKSLFEDSGFLDEAYPSLSRWKFYYFLIPGSVCQK
ncbi:hypothetical protein O181_006121 [Austropuccinia psidii MF-1]|uniref:Wax synthase domain-containing protein n=1 Tax=Austropuccinia psidii MF-1 TaxID=1389203 RepID=A0A9Q3GGG8_9BASI|nr:hypothetical protein [Austropuccinia psidii MF-1]